MRTILPIVTLLALSAIGCRGGAEKSGTTSSSPADTAAAQEDPGEDGPGLSQYTWCVLSRSRSRAG